MEILDGHCDYVWGKELTALMTNMANLSKYRPIFFDSSSQVGEDRESFQKALDDYDLFKAGLVFIFFQPVYRERIAECFENLTDKQQSNFHDYYSSFGETAFNQGFSAEYVSIMQALKPIESRIVRAINYLIYGSFYYCVYYSTNSVFVTVVLFVLISFLDEIRNKTSYNEISTYQADLIIRKLNKQSIDDNIEFAKKRLIVAKWLTSEGKIEDLL